MEPRAEANSTGPPSDMPDIGNEPCKSCRFKLILQKNLLVKTNVVYRLFQAAWFDRWRYGGYTINVPEMRHFVLLA